MSALTFLDIESGGLFILTKDHKRLVCYLARTDPFIVKHYLEESLRKEENQEPEFQNLLRKQLIDDIETYYQYAVNTLRQKFLIQEKE
jgi:hypothetical protein